MDSLPKRKRRWPKLCIVLGSLLAVLCLILTAGWFYYLAPMRHLVSPEWMAAHSEQDRWHEEELLYWRTNKSPDLMFRPDKILFYGDKEWFKWLLDRVNGGKPSFRVCGCTFSCLATISNHYFDSVEGWNQWYAANKDKTQEEWLQDGFAQQGVKIALPPSPSDTDALLALLGKRSDDPKKTNFRLERAYAAPSNIRYNAYRWLRDMGFDPVSHLIARHDTKLVPEIFEGIREYRKLELKMPASNRLGILAFGMDSSDSLGEYGWSAPPITRKSIGLMAYGFMLITGLSGFLLVRHGIRVLRFRSASASPTHEPPNATEDSNHVQ